MNPTTLMAAAVITMASTVTANAQSVSPSDISVPTHTCEKPTGGPGLDKSNYERQQRFQKKVDAYKDCINTYTKEMGNRAQDQYDLGKKYQEAGNAAINEYNAYVTDLNKNYGEKDGSSSKQDVPVPPPKPSKY